MSVRRCAIALVLVLAATAAACTGDDPPPGDGEGPSSSTTSALPTVDAGDVEFERGAFIYEFDSVTAALSWEGGEGTLSIDNGSDRELGEPGLYAVTNDQAQVTGKVVDTATIPPGESTEFTISFPDALTYERMGIIVLLFGDENWGAFAPVPVAA